MFKDNIAFQCKNLSVIAIRQVEIETFYNFGFHPLFRLWVVLLAYHEKFEFFSISVWLSSLAASLTFFSSAFVSLSLRSKSICNGSSAKNSSLIIPVNHYRLFKSFLYIPVFGALELITREHRPQQ